MPKISALKKIKLIPTLLALFVGSVSSYVFLLVFWYATSLDGLGFRYLDTVWLYDWYAMRTPFLTDCMFVITLFGADLTIILGTVISYFFKRMDKRREAVIFAVAGGFAVALNLVLKFIFMRARPDSSALIAMDSYSYPSGHAMNAFVFYGLLAYYIVVFTKRELLEVLTAVVCVAMIVLVGASRIYLGVHYPTDVIAGYIAGFCLVVTAVYINHLHLKR